MRPPRSADAAATFPRDVSRNNLPTFTMPARTLAASDPLQRLPDRGVSGQDLKRLVVCYTVCSLYGRCELVGDVYFGPAIFGTAHGDPLDELFDQFTTTMPCLLGVLFE